MAFQLQVQPQSGQNIGQGILMAAQGIAHGMAKYYQKKEENDQIAKAADMFSVAAQKNPFLAQAMGIQDVKDTAAIKNAIKGAGGPGKFVQIASGVHEMSMQAENARRQAELAAIQQAEEARKAAQYQQGQQQVADLRMVNQVAQGSGSPLNNQAYGEIQKRLKTNPYLRPVAAAVSVTGQPMTNKELVDVQENATPFNPQVYTAPDGTKFARTSRNSAQVLQGDFRMGQPMMNSRGEYIGTTSFNAQTGKMTLLGPNGKESEVPAGAQPVTATGLGKGIPQVNDFKKTVEDLTSAEISLGNMDRYMKSVKDANAGLNSLADKFSVGVKTLIDKGDLNPQEIALKLSEGQLQGLLGANRTNVVGGGVMTEQDALRIIARLGGDAGALRNKELVKAAIAQVYADRYKQYQNDLGFYNSAVDQYYGSKNFKPKEPLKFNTDFANALQGMGDPAAPATASSNVDSILKKYTQ